MRSVNGLRCNNTYCPAGVIVAEPQLAVQSVAARTVLHSFGFLPWCRSNIDKYALLDKPKAHGARSPELTSRVHKPEAAQVAMWQGTWQWWGKCAWDWKISKSHLAPLWQALKNKQNKQTNKQKPLSRWKQARWAGVGDLWMVYPVGVELGSMWGARWIHTLKRNPTLAQNWVQ